ncbi:MAG TPA: hypothetical protein VI818_01360, partial [Candidatus Thermoplasmatota archaeon]|nr:hypothetical protein [Candidatus Thermoplasmatota archaeon]
MRPLAMTALTLFPFLVPVAGVSWFAANCEDDWCPGALAEAAVAILVAAVVVGAVQWRLTRQGVGAWRAGSAAWSFGLGLAAVV